MHRLFRKEQILTIPNLLSLFRLALLPVIAWFYSVKQNYIAAIILLALSGLTDIVDGTIARKCNMISDFGKILDPIADKLTQIVMLMCLAAKYPAIVWMVLIFVLKELAMTVLGYLAIRKKDSVNSAKWYGKANTVIIYSTIVLLILFPGIPEYAVNAMIGVCIGAIIASFILYANMYRLILGKKHS